MANEFYGGGRKQVIQRVISLGTSTVTTATYIVGCVPRKCRVTGVRAAGQAAVTATTLTCDVLARTAAGATGATLLASAIDIDFASAAAAKTGVDGTLTATHANRGLAEGRLIEATITASSATAGPGDLVVEVEYEPEF